MGNIRYDSLLQKYYYGRDVINYATEYVRINGLHASIECLKKETIPLYERLMEESVKESRRNAAVEDDLRFFQRVLEALEMRQDAIMPPHKNSTSPQSMSADENSLHEFFYMRNASGYAVQHRKVFGLERSVKDIEGRVLPMYVELRQEAVETDDMDWYANLLDDERFFKKVLKKLKKMEKQMKKITKDLKTCQKNFQSDEGDVSITFEIRFSAKKYDSEAIDKVAEKLLENFQQSIQTLREG